MSRSTGLAKGGRRGKAPPIYVYLYLWKTWTTQSDVDQPEVDWDRVLAKLRRSPKIAFYSDDERQGMLLLHLACALYPPLSVLNLIIEANPNAIRRKSHEGLTPLHIACGRNASSGVVKLLIGRDPKSLVEVDENGQSPLHWACRSDVLEELVYLLLRADISMARSTYTTASARRRGCPSPLEILYQNKGSPQRNGLLWSTNQWNKLTYLLWATHYGTLVARNSQTFSTIHAALALDCPRDVIDNAIHLQGMSSCGVRDIYGNLPLHYAVSAKAVHRIALQKLLEYFPAAASSSDSEGRLPLHQALKHGKTWGEGLDALYAAYPLAISLPDKESGFPLAFLAATNGDVETIFSILREFPQVIRIRQVDHP